MTTLASAGPQGELDCVVGRRIHRTRRDYLEFIDRERFAIIAPLATWQAGLRGESNPTFANRFKSTGRRAA